MKESQIQNALHQWRTSHGHKFIAPNVQMNWGEADLLSITQAGFIYEHEIKISRADYKADFKKFKHIWFSKVAAKNPKCPNYFVYVCPNGLIKVDEIPDYAGLYYWNKPTDFSKFGTIEIVKEPPRLHREKVTVDLMSKLARSMMFRYWSFRLNGEAI